MFNIAHELRCNLTLPAFLQDSYSKVDAKTRTLSEEVAQRSRTHVG
jgi:hypothetical protein